MKNTVLNPDLAGSFALPITEHALKRQAKRMQKELSAILAAPPSKINLAYAQERLSHVWGHTSWHDLTQNALLQAPETPKQTTASPGLMAKLGFDGTLNVLTALIDREHRDNPWHPPAIRLLKVALMCTKKTSPHLKVRREAWPKEGVFDSTSVAYWTRLRPLVDLAAEQALPAKEQSQLVELLQDIPTMPTNCFRISSQYGVHGEDSYERAKLHHAYYASIATNAIEIMAVFEQENPVLWDSSWRGLPQLDLENWRWLDESWLVKNRSGDNNPLRLRVTGQPWYSEQSAKHGGKFTAHDALVLAAMGMQSDNGRMLLSWLRRPDALVQMATDLGTHMNLRLAQAVEVDPEKVATLI